MDIAEFRRTVGTFPSGVTVVTTHDDGHDYGLTVSAFCSLSLDPPMVLVALDSASRTLTHLGQGQPIAVSVLSESQGALAKQFATHGGDKFADVMVHRVAHDVPVLDGVSAWFVGTVAGLYLGGDHTIITVLVEQMGHVDEARPLLYQRGLLREWPV
ncbi:flavin reductase family protein [Staphylococcus chromogenes]|nr:flavin reductase family protein [Staphylococcus chromogenes]